MEGNQASGKQLINLLQTRSKAQTDRRGSTNNLQGCPAIIQAAIDNDCAQIESLLSEQKTKVDQKDANGCSALMHAAINGKKEAMEFLIQKGARITAKCDIGETPMMKAVKVGDLSVCELLYNEQINLIKNTSNRTMISRDSGADNEGYMRDVRRRVLDAKDDEGVSAFMKAAEAGGGYPSEEELAEGAEAVPKILQFLLDKGATPDAKDDQGWTAMMWAALAGHLGVCKWLKEQAKMECGYLTDSHEHALHKAAANGHWDVCAFLLQDAPNLLNKQDSVNHQTAIMWASAMGHVEVVKHLAKEGAKLDNFSSSGLNAFMFAAKFGRTAVCQAFMDVAKEKKAPNPLTVKAEKTGCTAIFFAVDGGYVETVECFINQFPAEERTKYVNTQNKLQETALMRAAQNGHKEIIELLLKFGADVLLTDEHGRTARDCAEGILMNSCVQPLKEAEEALQKNLE